MNRFIRVSVLAATLIAITSFSAAAQKKSLDCRGGDWNTDKFVTNCEVREQTLAPNGGPIVVDGGQNGGISVKGWDQNQVLVRARVRASAPTATEAEALARQVTIGTQGGKIFASGPENSQNSHWEVTYEIFVPRRSDLSLKAHNGGIAISEVNGRIDFNAMNGGVVLRRVAGNVRGSTTNGGLMVELAGDHWDGETLDVKTTNGGVNISIPENYSAHLETSTVNGNINVDFPVNVEGRISKELALNLGSGGATIRAVTTNGGVRIQRSTINP